MLLVMGTSLQVAPVSMIPEWVDCEHRVLFNREQVLDSFKVGKDIFLDGNCDDRVEELCAILNWKDDLLEHHGKVQLKKKEEEKVDSSAPSSSTKTTDTDKESSSEQETADAKSSDKGND